MLVFDILTVFALAFINFSIISYVENKFDMKIEKDESGNAIYLMMLAIVSTLEVEAINYFGSLKNVSQTFLVVMTILIPIALYFAAIYLIDKKITSRKIAEFSDSFEEDSDLLHEFDKSYTHEDFNTYNQDVETIKEECEENFEDSNLLNDYDSFHQQAAKEEYDDIFGNDEDDESDEDECYKDIHSNPKYHNDGDLLGATLL